MNPKYKFTLSVNGVADTATPVWKDDLAIDFEKETSQEFFRRKLSGKLVFQGSDYMRIVSAAFDAEFSVEIDISYDFGRTWAEYWRGTFWKTDCEFDEDACTVSVTPSVADAYGKLLAGIEKEYDLIKLAPDIIRISADKRPMIQIYVAGQSSIGCFLAGMSWEEDVEPTTNSSIIVNRCHFAKLAELLTVKLTQTGVPYPILTDVVFQRNPDDISDPYLFDISKDGYVYKNYVAQEQDEQAGEISYVYHEISNASGTVLWRNKTQGLSPSGNDVVLEPVTGSGASGDVTMSFSLSYVYGRYVCDVTEIDGNATFEIPSNDIVEDNRNYRRCYPYDVTQTILFSDTLSEDATEYGLYEPGKYYAPPVMPYGQDVFPVARNSWGRISTWFTFYALDLPMEQAARAKVEIREAYPIASIISVLLQQFAPEVTHEATTAYSQFLYGRNILGYEMTLCAAQKSNIVTIGYDQPAQKAPITLKSVFDMLRDCFRCYWWVDAQNRLRIEHIQYFRNGGRYSGTGSIGMDLTTSYFTRNRKTADFGQNKYTFDKPEMTERYQFSWMDDATILFNGYPIDIISKYVEQGKIENVSISNFSSDFDYIILNPGDISKDGFVLLGAVSDGNGGYKLPYVNFRIGVNDHYLQNAYVAFCILQGYYAYDMPASEYKINGEQKTAIGVSRLKTQDVSVAFYRDPEITKIIKTTLGLGHIRKLSVNLSSRNGKATLVYDTEE